MRVLFCLIIAALPGFAADRWVRLTTPDFELYTQTGEKDGRDVIFHFEQVRAFFLKASPVKKGADFPVRIVEFGSDKQFAPYRPNQLASAYFADTPARDYIAMGEASRADFSIAIHEYMHLIVQRSGLKLPVWLNEGWADVYSSLRPMGRETAIGDLPGGRMKDLERYPWLSFAELTSVNLNSPAYHEASRIGIFYAESWALTHMLYLAPEYEANFGKFVMALHQGHSAAEACRIAWNRTPAQIFADLRTYFDRKRIVGKAYAVRLAKKQEEPLATPVNDFEARLMLADLLAAAGRPAEAASAYTQLEREQPDRGDVAMAMGYLAWQSRDGDAALKYFGRAYDAGETDPRMCFHLAALMLENRDPPQMVIPVLQRALKAKPDYTEAQVQLGAVQINSHDFAGGIATLTGIRVIGPDEAPVVFCALGQAYLETGDLASAGRNIQTCGQWAKTPPELARVEQLAAVLNARRN